MIGPLKGIAITEADFTVAFGLVLGGGAGGFVMLLLIMPREGPPG